MGLAGDDIIHYLADDKLTHTPITACRPNAFDTDRAIMCTKLPYIVLMCGCGQMRNDLFSTLHIIVRHGP